MSSTQEKQVVVKEQPYRGLLRSPEKLEEEIAELEKQHSEAQEEEEEAKREEEEEKTLTAEEKTWKQRYGDLRRHSQSQTEELKSKLDNLKEQLASLQKEKVVDMPTSEEDLRDFAEKHPTVYKAIETIAMKNAMSTTQKLREEQEKLRASIEDTKRDAARKKLEALHPDIDDISMSADFADWLKTQPDEIKNVILEGTDPMLVGRYITLFKIETQSQEEEPKKRGRPPKKSIDDSDVARAITGKSPVEPKGKENKVWTESEIAKLTADEFEALEEEILAAAREGRVVQDTRRPRFPVRGS